jgi:dephospho-CoA kinase
MTRVVAMSGGIGTGKTTVGAMFGKLGAVVICADEITHDLQSPGSPLVDEIVAAFGPEVLDARGELDRAALGAIVFRDPEARRRLEDLVHPQVGVEMGRRLEAARATGVPLVILDLSVLFEAKHARGEALVEPSDPWSAVIVVWAPPRLQIERQLSRNDYGREEAERRVRAQIPIDEKREMADHVIDNSGSLEATERQVCALYQELISPPPREAVP